MAVDRPMAKRKDSGFYSESLPLARRRNFAKDFLVKGRLVGIQGEFRPEVIKNKDGATVYTTDVYADRVEFLEWGEKSDTKRKADDSFEQTPGVPEGFATLDDDEEIPFRRWNERK